MTTDYMKLYIKDKDELVGKTIKVIDTGFCNEGLYIITEDGMWTYFKVDTGYQGEDLEIVINDDEDDIKYQLFKADYIVKELDKYTDFDYKVYNEKQINIAQEKLEETRRKQEEEEKALFKKLLEKYGDDL